MHDSPTDLDALDELCRRVMGANGLDDLAPALELAEAALGASAVLRASRAALDKADKRAAALLKENEQLRDRIAGNERTIPIDVPLGQQRDELEQVLRRVGQMNYEGRLASVVVMWSEGRAVVAHVVVDPRPLVEVATKMPGRSC